MAESSIQLLLGLPPERFLAEYWPTVPRQFDGPIERLGELATLPELRDVPSFITAHRGLAFLHRRRPDGSYDRETSIDIAVDSAAALATFESGTMMDLQNVERWQPTVRAWLRRLHAELELDRVAQADYCHAFVSPAATGVPKHFDNREVIAVQLVGRKRWRIAPNPTLPMPLMPHVAGDVTHPFNRHAAGAALDDPDMPADSVSYELGPGSAIFIPRGYWHATHALDDSLSLSFGFRVSSWVELFANTAIQQLSREPAWRATAYDTERTRPPGIETFLRTLERVIEELRAAPPPTTNGDGSGRGQRGE